MSFLYCQGFRNKCRISANNFLPWIVSLLNSCHSFCYIKGNVAKTVWKFVLFHFQKIIIVATIISGNTVIQASQYTFLPLDSSNSQNWGISRIRNRLIDTSYFYTSMSRICSKKKREMRCHVNRCVHSHVYIQISVHSFMEFLK